MDAPTTLYALRWLIHDTFLQAIMSRVMWIMLGLSGLCIVFCLGVSVEADTMSLLFGTASMSFGGSPEQNVAALLGVFASWVAGVVGVLMALVWTAGFIPEALQPSAASVLLAKPAPRWLFLAGKYLGVICFVALHVSIFFVGTWLALGLKTDVWMPQYLLGIPLLVFHFAVVYSFSVMLAVLFRSTMACVVGAVIFWLVCFGMNYGRDFAVAYAELNARGAPLSGTTRFLSDAGYWLLPKPADYMILLEKALDVSDSTAALEAQPPFKNVLASGDFHPLFAILTSCAFAAFALWAAAAELAKTDY